MGEWTDKAKAVFDFVGTLSEEYPGIAQGFGTMHQAAGEKGALHPKQKELIALGIAITIRCEGCIACHDSIAWFDQGRKSRVIEVGIPQGDGFSAQEFDFAGQIGGTDLVAGQVDHYAGLGDDTLDDAVVYLQLLRTAVGTVQPEDARAGVLYLHQLVDFAENAGPDGYDDCEVHF